MNSNDKAFTLIELLIVVAIIGILAAIAIPNFLEAQTRAKVTRAQAEMRNLSMVLEAYCVDEDAYILSVCPFASMQWADARGTWIWYSRLTTPVSYMTSIPTDPFSNREPFSWAGENRQMPYHYYSGPDIPWENTQRYINYPRKMYTFVSLGPDTDLDVVVDITDSDAFVLYDITKTNFGGGSWNGLPYDASNGTVSEGDIYKFNGDRVLPLFQN